MVGIDAIIGYSTAMDSGFGVVIEQGFQPVFDPTPSTLGVVTGNDATFFIF